MTRQPTPKEIFETLCVTAHQDGLADLSAVPAIHQASVFSISNREDEDIDDISADRIEG